MLDMTVIYDLAIVALRILMPVYAIIIVYQCYAAMRRHEGPKSLLLHFTIQLQDLNFLLFSGKIQSAEAGQATLSLMTLPFQEITAFF